MNNSIKKNRDQFIFIGASIFILLLIIFIHSDTYSFDFKIKLSDYLYTQWIFNYDYGFVKRAFVGEFLNYFNIESSYKHVRIISIFIFLSIYAIFQTIILAFLKNLNFSNKYIIYFSACFLSLSFTTSQWLRELSRFDQIGQLILLISLLLIIKNTKSIYTLLFIIFTLPIIALTHEGLIVFFIPTLIYIYYQKYKNPSHIILLSIESIVLISIILLYGTMSNLQANAIIDAHLNDYKFKPYAVSTSLLTLKENIITNYQTFISTQAYLKILFTFIFCLPVLLFIKINVNKRTFYTIICFAGTPLLLSLVAFDYIRWFALFLFNLVLIFMYLSIENKINKDLILSNFNKFKNQIFIYSAISLLLGPLGVGNIFANFHDINQAWEKREQWSQEILVKLNDPIPLSDINLISNDESLRTQLSFIKSDVLEKEITSHYIDAANANNNEAQNTLGYMQFYGINMPINYCSALKNFTKASQANNSNALHNLSELYRHGVCVEQNINKANSLLTQASSYGNLTSKLILANSYLNGENGFPQDKKEAIKLLTELKESGNLPAEILLESLQSSHVQKST